MENLPNRFASQNLWKYLSADLELLKKSPKTALVNAFHKTERQVGHGKGPRKVSI